MDKRLFDKKHFLWRKFTFSGYISRGQFWTEIAMRSIGYFCAVILLSIAVTVALPLDTEGIIALMDILIPILDVLWLIPIVILSRRRLRDAGYSAKSYLWLLIPGIGVIAFLARLCARTAPRKPENVWLDYD